jgi:hypothetical protein
MKKRLDDLEEAKEQEEKNRTFIVICYQGDPKSTDYVIDQCEAAASDKEIFEKALGAAFVEITGKNPLDSKDALILIEKNVALKTVEKLRSAGIEVAVDVDGIEI